MTQTLRQSMIESIVDTTVGLCIACGLSIVILHAIGTPNPTSTSLLLTGILTGASLLRKFLVRRFFDGLNNRETKARSNKR